MLYLDVEAEGRILRAFVDTGAQVTVMSAACAARCGLLSKVDKRFAGRAVGVGSAKILGRIHDAHLRYSNIWLIQAYIVHLIPVCSNWHFRRS
jgi:DNA damage-inducible protein 1